MADNSSRLWRTEERTYTQEDLRQRAWLDLKQVCDYVGVSRMSVYVFMKSYDFPRPCQVGERLKRWDRAEIDEWIRSRQCKVKNS